MVSLTREKSKGMLLTITEENLEERRGTALVL
jgi:hypothetical protein